MMRIEPPKDPQRSSSGWRRRPPGRGVQPGSRFLLRDARGPPSRDGSIERICRGFSSGSCRAREARRPVSRAAQLSKRAGVAASHLSRSAVSDIPRAVDLARKAVERVPMPRSGNYRNTLGVALYRKGDWKGAIKALEKSVELRAGGTSHDWFFLAMARWQLGEKEQARRDYDRAVEGMAKSQPDNDELPRFRDEASALLGIPHAGKTEQSRAT